MRYLYKTETSNLHGSPWTRFRGLTFKNVMIGNEYNDITPRCPAMRYRFQAYWWCKSVDEEEPRSAPCKNRKLRSCRACEALRRVKYRATLACVS